MFVDNVVPIDDQISDQTNQLQGDEWDPALEAILDSESDAKREIEEWAGKIILNFIIDRHDSMYKYICMPKMAKLTTIIGQVSRDYAAFIKGASNQ